MSTRLVENGRAQMARLRADRNAAFAAIASHVPLDEAILGIVGPETRAVTKRGDALPVGCDGWSVFRHRQGPQRVRIEVVRLWYPNFKAPDYSTAPAFYGPSVATAAMLYMRGRAAEDSGSYVATILTAFVRFAQYLDTVARFTDRDPSLVFSRGCLNGFARWAEERTPSTPDSYPTVVLGFVRWAYKIGVPGFTRAMAQAASEVRLRARVAGHIARVGHPRKGALDEQERQELLASLANPCPDHDPLIRALLRLCWETGLRKTQLSALNWGQLKHRGAGRGAYVLVRRAKRPSSEAAKFTERTISNELYDLLRSARPAHAHDDTPMFGRGINKRLTRWARQHNLLTLREQKRARSGKEFRRFARGEVLGWRLKITAHRLRRTLATRLAEAGAGAATICAALDDDTMGMAAVYAANSSSMVETLRETLDTHPSWIRVLRLFAGRVGGDDGRLPVIAGGSLHLNSPVGHARRIGIIGRCRSQNACTLFPPLDCYTCTWMDAEPDPQVHRRQLEQIIAELTEMKGVSSDRMAVILKQAGLAISDLIERIERSSARVTARVVESQEQRMSAEAAT